MSIDYVLQNLLGEIVLSAIGPSILFYENLYIVTHSYIPVTANAALM